LSDSETHERGLKDVTMKRIHPLIVTRGLDPRVHLLRMKLDCRVKPWSSPAMTMGKCQLDAP
jgi:hypothetical protein